MVRRNNRVMDDLFKLARRLPWWLGLFLAAGAYLLFHHEAPPAGLS